MRRSIYGSTALLTATVLAGSPAIAGDGIHQSRLGGEFRNFMVSTAEDRPRDAFAPLGLNEDTHFSGKVALTDWLSVGLDGRLASDGADVKVQDTYVFLEGGWGQIRLGNDARPIDAFTVGAPSVLPGRSGHVNQVAVADQTETPIEVSVTTTALTGDREKIVYYSPEVAGFQIGLSFTPEDCDKKQGACAKSVEELDLATPEDDRSDAVEMAVSYGGELSDVGFSVFAGYARSHLRLDRDDDPALAKDQWDVGGAVSYRGFSVGAGYGQDHQGVDRVLGREDWNVGVAYETGPWGVSLGYARALLADSEGVEEDQLEQAELAFVYDLGAGFMLGGALQWWDYSDLSEEDIDETSAFGVVLGSKFRF
ncbi:MAG: porin [Minwuiales bacterium]|nr:porin [Minwuiales bacterium]